MKQTSLDMFIIRGKDGSTGDTSKSSDIGAHGTIQWFQVFPVVRSHPPGQTKRNVKRKRQPAPSVDLPLQSLKLQGVHHTYRTLILDMKDAWLQV